MGEERGFPARIAAALAAVFDHPNSKLGVDHHT
jgi:hypothetical protein